MRASVLLLSGYLLCGALGAALPSCLICDDEETLIRACDTLTATVNEVELSCGLAVTGAQLVCGSVCTDHASCPDERDIAACADAIRGLGCNAITFRASYIGLEACAELFEDMATSCESSGGDFDDDD